MDIVILSPVLVVMILMLVFQRGIVARMEKWYTRSPHRLCTLRIYLFFLVIITIPFSFYTFEVVYTYGIPVLLFFCSTMFFMMVGAVTISYKLSMIFPPLLGATWAFVLAAISVLFVRDISFTEITLIGGFFFVGFVYVMFIFHDLTKHQSREQWEEEGRSFRGMVDSFNNNFLEEHLYILVSGAIVACLLFSIYPSLEGFFGALIVFILSVCRYISQKRAGSEGYLYILVSGTVIASLFFGIFPSQRGFLWALIMWILSIYMYLSRKKAGSEDHLYILISGALIACLFVGIFPSLRGFFGALIVLVLSVCTYISRKRAGSEDHLYILVSGVIVACLFFGIFPSQGGSVVAFIIWILSIYTYFSRKRASSEDET